MKFCIVGAGAMGSLFALQLARAGKDVQLLDEWEKQLEAVRQEGLHGQIGEENYHVRVPICRPREATEKADVLILFVKSMKLGEHVEKVRHLLHEKTSVLCLLNGVGHEEVLRQYVPEENIIMGVTIWTSGLDKPGYFHSGAQGKIELQNFHPGKEAEARARQLVKELNDARMGATYSEDVLRSIWRKVCVNGTSNTLCTLLEGRVGEVMPLEETRPVVEAILREFLAAAEIQGVHLDFETILDYILSTSVSASVRNHYPSMYQDLILNQRKTEIDYMNGAVARILEAAGKPAPTCRLLTQLMHAKETLRGAN